MIFAATIAFYLGVVAYSAAAVLFFANLARREAAETEARWAPRALAAGVAAHAGHLVIASVLTSVCPVQSLHFALSLSSLMTSGAYLWLRRRMQIDAVGVVVAPLAVTFLVGAQFVGAGGGPATFPRTLLALHVAANVLGLGLFLLAGAAGAFYLVQERRLKAKRFSPLGGKLPPLDSLDLTEHRLLLAGFPLLTFGAITGAIFAVQLESMTGVELVRAILAYVTWFLVAAVLLLRAIAGWSGRRAAYGTLAGTLCVMAVMLIYAAQSGARGGL